MPSESLSKIIVAGSRSITDAVHVEGPLSQITAGGATRGQYEIISGGATSVDTLAEQWADRHNCEYTEFEPNWDTLGNTAGPKRNAEMADYAAPDGTLVAVWDGESPGTRDMIDKALSRGLEVHVYQKGD